MVYETHSVYSVENERLVRRLVREMNALARERHAEEQRRAAWLAALAAQAEANLPGVAKSNQNQGEKRAKQAKTKEADKYALVAPVRPRVTVVRST